jgi:glycerol-3-phosphate acyltransferase PlsY
VTRISSLGSLTAAGVVMIISVMSLVFHRIEPVYAFFACMAAVIVIALHRANIQRLLEGNENRVQRFF